MITQDTHVARLERLAGNPSWARVVSLCALLSLGLGGCSAITWDAGRGDAHVVCRDTESVVTLPGGQVLTITHERGRGLCDAVEALGGRR